MATGDVAVSGSRLGGLVSKPVLVLINAAVLAACVAAAAALSTAAQWRPLDLLLVLAAFAAISELSTVAFFALRRSLSAVALVLAMAFLGPAPAVALAVIPVTIDTARRGLPLIYIVANPAGYALTTLAGSLVAGALFGGHPPQVGLQTLLFAITALSVAADCATFVTAVTIRAIHADVSVRRSFRREFVPVTPYLLISAAFTGAAAVVWVTAGIAALAGLLLMLLASGGLVKAVAREQAREQQVAELAIERARLLGEALTAEERERVRLASEIHDDALQQFALAQLDLDDESAATVHLRAGIAALRRTLARIVPAAEMRSSGFRSTLEALAADLCGPAGLAWDVSVDESVAASDGTLVYSLARELVTNAVKHADASRVDIRVASVGERVRLEVRDDGRGFDTAQAGSAGHVGLTLVENRARAADGRLEITSAYGGGTVASVEIATSRRLMAAAPAGRRE
jgi:signal transduction histidine kinase